MTIDPAALVAAADLYEADTGDVDEIALGAAIDRYEEAKLDKQAKAERVAFEAERAER